MKKFIAISLFVFACLTAGAQEFYNSWIDYNKTYYKFKVGKTGVYRIGQPLLASNNLGSTPAEQFQLWRNGREVPLFTSVSNGTLPSNGYIEFWGEQNDGIPDKALYKNPANHLSDALSLETDTAAYFLTINSAGNNQRITEGTNNVAGNTLAPEPFFIYNYEQNFREKINRGKAENFGEYVYSSTYDIGEFWSTRDITPVTPYTHNAGNLYVASSGPNAILNVSFAGNSFLGYARNVQVNINNSQVINAPLGVMSAAVFTNNNVPLSLISSPATGFTFSDANAPNEDRIVTGFLHLQYPRLFNFGGANNFPFTMPATTTGNYIEISNFNSGGAVPVLYDLTNLKRYQANTTVTNLLRFALPASNSERQLVLVSEDANNILPVTGLTPRNFINYGISSNQGDYLIISNKILIGSGGPVQGYRDYRSSVAGGSFNGRVIDIDELVDQFAYGIKKHPLSVKNFLGFARNNFSVKPKYALLIGKSVTYDEYRYNETSQFADRLNLVPTFGWPASDVLLGSASLDPVPATPIGRISAISPAEVQVYLDKIKLYEQQQADATQTIANKAWMKTIVHVTGANDASLDASLSANLNSYKRIITDTFYGGNVYSFNKTTTGSATPITDALMTNLFNDGISLLNYFGHSAATTLDYNLNDPTDYNNYGKYPVFMVGGCNAGNIYSYDTSRFSVVSSLSEKYVLSKDRGSIAFLASTHFGVQSYLDSYNQGFYRSFGVTDYNQPISNNIYDAIMNLLGGFGDSTRKTLHAEENALHGDPALKINAHAKPDFVVEEPQVIINPSFISVADNNFNVKCYFYNIGKATGDSVSILVSRKYPDGTNSILASQRIKSVRFKDSVEFTIPIISSRDKGQNSISVTIDNDNRYSELSEMNNSVTKNFFIYEDELKPVYPYEFSIVNKSGIKLYASTANPLSLTREYLMEIDTTALFNSSLKNTQSLTSVGGVLEFTPTIGFTDSTVYYWRVAPKPENNEYRWNNSSFVYLPSTGAGYNQSHFYQHTQSNGERIYIDSASRKWKYDKVLSALTMYNAVFGYSGSDDAQFSVQLNGQTITQSACLGHSIIFNVFDPVTLKPYYNQKNPSTNPSGIYGGFMGSHSNAGCTKKGKDYNFEFHYSDSSDRRKMRDFMDWVPNGLLVTMRLIYDEPFDQTAQLWQSDQSVYGVGNTFYDRLKQNGFTGIDSFSYPRTWVFNYEKNNANFNPEWQFSEGLYDMVIYQRNIASSDTLGYITSPVFGPARAWKKVIWNGYSTDATSGDNATVQVIGMDTLNNESVLYTLTTTQQNVDISSINVTAYPFIKLKMRNADSINLTPYQLRYWRLLYDAVPEGALAPNILYKFNDTLAVGQDQQLSIAFKNVSETSFADSIKVKLVLYDAGNNATVIPVKDLKKLNAGDTAIINVTIDTKTLSGSNNIYLDVNPGNDQPEQFHFNNFLYKDFAVSIDNYKPTLDVTFDGVHILNNDIVSAQPHVLITMRDESDYLMLDDTSLFTVTLIYPNNEQRRFYFNSDTLLFTPASGQENKATVEFNPYLTEDGIYQLIVHGKDKTGNAAGNTDYKVSFQVYNKPMITNMFNYPNPFTTSTAFVFTVTGSQVPQNLRIQILTITGKIVKEITLAELGDIHIGRNITSYKWDGTDQYGQKLGNGVYLYRVLTNLNGKGLDKFPTYSSDGYTPADTDKYFNKGYGKMYLMR